MKLFGYYALHSVKNQLKKLLKSWVLILLLVCFVIGGVIGFGAATLEDAAEDRTEEIVLEEAVAEEEEKTELSPEVINAYIELGTGAVILVFMLFQMIGADKNGSRIFLPADVNLLFASPMKPQSVLMFRLLTQMGVIILSSVYLGFQIPNLVLNLGMNIWAAVGILATVLGTIASGKLIQVLLYTLCSTHSGMKKYLRKAIYILGAVILGSFMIYKAMTGKEYLDAATSFYNHSLTRYVPLWGWLKGLCMCSVEGNLFGALLFFVLIIAGGIGLALIIWNLKADFYEDAMAKSEEVAEILEAAQAEKSTGIIKRKKDRGEKVRRDGIKHGWGANVFFHRILYNRFRFAHFGFLTKTTETYLIVTAAVSVICKYITETESFLPVVLVLCVLVFYRTFGNPLSEDTSKDFFRMIPENTEKKLFWSITAGTVGCLLDIFPALILTNLFFMVNPLEIIVWIPVILSVDFFGTNAGAFINLSTPPSAGVMIKQIVLVMFLYFGLLPDIAIMAVGIVFDQISVAVILCAVVNFALGGLFLVVTPLFLDPKSKPVKEKKIISEEEKLFGKKVFSRLGLGCFVILFLATGLQILLVNVLPDYLERDWAMWVYTFAPIYLVAIPVGLMIIRNVPIVEIDKKSAGIGLMVKAVFVSLFLMYSGNLLGNLIVSLIGVFTGSTIDVAIMDYALADSFWLKVLFLVILAPVIEEYVFRKQLIDRMNCYGGKLAVITSALMFGLFHGNLNQFFYAFGLGLVFGYVYLKTGKLKYSIGLHMFINFLGSVVSTALLEGINLEELDNAGVLLPEELLTPSLILFLCYVLGMIIAALIGLAVLCRNNRKITFETAVSELPKGSRLKTAYFNLGMILFFIFSMIMIVLSLI